MFNPNDYVALVPKMNMGVMVDLAKKSDNDFADFDKTHHIVPLTEAIKFVSDFPQPREFITSNDEVKQWLIEQGVNLDYPEYYEGYEFVNPQK